MLKILIIGDSHIPRRAKEVPSEIYEKIKQLSNNNLFDYTFFTGDVINAPKFLNFLKLKTKKDLFIVLGNMDYYGGNQNAPIYQKLQLPILGKELKIGMTHGAQISPRGDHSQLELLATENDYHILISGHTHRDDIKLTTNGTLLLNPGSVTGAWSFVASQIPSFIILNVNEENGELFIVLYRLDRSTSQVKEEEYAFQFRNNRII